MQTAKTNSPSWNQSTARIYYKFNNDMMKPVYAINQLNYGDGLNMK